MSTTTIVPTRRSSATTRLPLPTAVAMLTAGLWLAVTGGDHLQAEDLVDGAMLMLFPLVGTLLLRDGRHRRVGAMCCAVGVTAGLGYLVGGYAEHDWVGRSLAGVLGSALFVTTIAVLMNFLPLNFPDGHLPSPRWRFVAWSAVAGVTLSVLSILLMPGRVDEDVAELGTNPLGLAALGPALELAQLVGLLVFAVAALLGLASLAVRWRRSIGPARRQVGILAAGFAVLIVLFLLDSTLQDLGGATYGVIAAVVALGAVPVAIGLALLRD